MIDFVDGIVFNNEQGNCFCKLFVVVVFVVLDDVIVDDKKYGNGFD